MMMRSLKLVLLVAWWSFVLHLMMMMVVVSGSPLLVKTRTYSYSVHRPDLCKLDDDHFANCYLCGKMTDEREIYYGCCAELKPFTHFCDRLLL